MTPKDLTISEAARLLSVTRDRVRALIAAGYLDAYEIPGCGPYGSVRRVRAESIERMRKMCVAKIPATRKTKTTSALAAEGERLADKYGI